MMKIYVAGAHRELARCEAMINAVKIMGFEVTLDWTASIRAFGGDQHDDRDLAARAQTAWDDIDAVIEADVIWLLLPRAITKGAWTELGAALMWNRICRDGRATDKKTIVASWQDYIAARDEDLPLFVAPADHIFLDDESALVYWGNMAHASKPTP